MAGAPSKYSGPRVEHSAAFRRRRFLNWFPLGLTYALLYMGRYNLTVAKSSLSSKQQLMTNEDFGIIFGAGTLVYAFSFLLNGPIVDRIGGRLGVLITSSGTLVSNLAMGFYLKHAVESGTTDHVALRGVFSVLYAVNMYFQSFGAVSIVKVNAHWFHVSERGGFSGIFGTMIASGIFLAFTVNGWLLDWLGARFPGQPMTHWVFFAPAVLLGLFFLIELSLLRDQPRDAGLADFDTGDASSGEDDKPIPLGPLFRRLFTNPVLLTIAGIELCTGVVRQGVMQWFPIYAKEVWALESTHPLVNGSWSQRGLVGACFATAAVSFVLATRTPARRNLLVGLGALAFLAPFLQGGWGGLLMVAGVIGGNVAGWVSDLFFQSRRGPAAAGLYALMCVCALGMSFVLSEPTNEVSWADEKSGLQAGDRIVELGGKPVGGWADVRLATKCVPATCVDSGWNAEACTCKSGISNDGVVAPGKLAAKVNRGGETLTLELPDPAAKQRAGDERKLKARPVLPMTPYALAVLVFLLSIGVIGTHGLLSGTATMDFGGRKAAATAVGMIDGAVYLGTAIQSVSLGYITSRNWAWWPPFLLPFAAIGFLLCLRIWNARPKSASAGH
jgi:OPA family glycerol-3-phosphate transporter-like MFS transporter